MNMPDEVTCFAAAAAGAACGGVHVLCDIASILSEQLLMPAQEPEPEESWCKADTVLLISLGG
jgi:hypothetical protein